MPMPKTEIDYSNTIIYKITCKDPIIQDVYVGHTTNFVQRKHAHKQSCVNVKAPNHACKLYAIIREHGGWKNWIMEIVHFFTCNNQYEARTKEQEYFVLLKATLNSIEPMSKPKPSIKTSCKPKPVIKPYANISDIIETSETTYRFSCNCCLFQCNKKSNYLQHLLTPKHLKASDGTQPTEKCQNFECNCGKQYLTKSGLWKHKKKCKPTTDAINNCCVDKEIIMLKMQENNELTNMLVEEHKYALQMMMEEHKFIIQTMIEEHKSSQQMMHEVIKHDYHKYNNP
jgi:hypothetical protein